MSKNKKKSNLHIQETDLTQLTPRERLDYHLYKETLMVLDCEIEAIAIFIDDNIGGITSEDLYNCKVRQASMLKIVNRIENLTYMRFEDLHAKAMNILIKAGFAY